MGPPRNDFFSTNFHSITKWPTTDGGRGEDSEIQLGSNSIFDDRHCVTIIILDVYAGAYIPENLTA